MNYIILLMVGVVIEVLLFILMANFFSFFFSLGYVLQEKYPDRKGILDRIEEFWRNFWRKIIK